MLTTLFIGLATMMMPIGMFLITISLVSDKSPASLYMWGIVASVIGFGALCYAFVRAFQEDKEVRKERKALEDAYSLMHRDMNDLANELKADRNERKRIK